MPLRNIVVIAIAILVSLTCHNAVSKSRFSQLFAEALETVHREALIAVDRRDLFEDSMQGMLSKFDRNTMYVSGRQFTSIEEDLDQKFGGVGMYLDVDEERGELVVLAPLPNLPAARAGLRPGDSLLAIDGQAVGPDRRQEAFDLLRGAPGTSAKVDIRREAADQTIVVTRESIPVTSVQGDWRTSDGTWDFYLRDHPDLAYLRIIQFGENTAQEVRAALQKIHDRPCAGLILDVRNNPGGLLPSAVEIADLFLPADKLIVETRGRNREVREQYRSTSEVVVPTHWPVAVLIDRNSASASEIVAACLQDHRRAVIVGERSFGKGTVQNWIPLEKGKSALKLTTASFWRPSGVNIDRASSLQNDLNDWGVRPDPPCSIKLTNRELAEHYRHRHLRDLAGILEGFNYQIADTWRIKKPFSPAELQALADEAEDVASATPRNRPASEAESLEGLKGTATSGKEPAPAELDDAEAAEVISPERDRVLERAIEMLRADNGIKP